MRWFLALCTAASAVPVLAADPAATPTAAQIEFFETKVRPVLADHCYSCHGPKKQSAGLRLDTSAGLKAGADNGPVFVAGDPAKSRLIKSVKREGEYPMPPKTPLPPAAVAVLAEWVKAGAAVPDDIAKAPTPDPKQHWAFQPIKEPAVPKLAVAVVNPIDAFVLAKLKEKGLSPAPRADRRTLIRRAYIDLIGMPPTAEEVDSFAKDESPDAWAKLIDKLLASPQYGERWGRYWLDIARYADTKGYVFQEDRFFAFGYTYRDYVIRSFNEDKPYDRFVTEQLAADLLPLGDDKRSLAAMGFLTLGRRFLSNQQDIIDDRIDVVTRGFMGLTVTCARCHDHKYDPIPTKDYYSLYGVFASSNEPAELPLIEEVKRTPEVVAFEAELAKREGDHAAEIAKRHAAALKKLRDPFTMAEYLRAVLDARGKTGEEVQNLLRQRDLTRHAFDRWRTFLEAEWKAKSPVYAPLLALSAIPEKDFEAKSGDAITNDTNALVAKALKEAKPKALKAAVEALVSVISAEPPPGEQSKDQVAVFVVRAPAGRSTSRSPTPTSCSTAPTGTRSRRSARRSTRSRRPTRTPRRGRTCSGTTRSRCSRSCSSAATPATADRSCRARHRKSSRRTASRSRRVAVGSNSRRPLPAQTTRSRPASWRTACGLATSAPASSARPRTSASAPTRRRTRSCSTGSQAASPRTGGA